MEAHPLNVCRGACGHDWVRVGELVAADGNGGRWREVGEWGGRTEVGIRKCSTLTLDCLEHAGTCFGGIKAKFRLPMVAHPEYLCVHAGC